MQRVRLEVLSGPPLRLFALLAPHLVNGGAHNTAWIGDYKGHRLLFAEGDGTCLALGCSRPFLARLGRLRRRLSDGWQMLHAHGSLTDEYDRAADGNVALTAEIADAGDRVPPRAGLRPHCRRRRRSACAPACRRRSTRQLEEYAAGWRGWQARLRSLDRKVDGHNVYRVSTAVLRCHESPTFPGGLIASLSIPWGGSKGDDDLGGYHLVWPRDLAQTAGAFLACGAHDEVLRVRALPARHPGGGRQLAAELLAGRHAVLARRPARRMRLPDAAAGHGLARGRACRDRCCRRSGRWWRARRASSSATAPGPARTAGRRMPATRRSRWPSQIAALLAAADLAEVCDVDGVADFLRDTADAWNEQIEDWIYVTDTRLAREVGVSGYYVRIAPEVPGEARAELRGMVEVRNRFGEASHVEADELISTDALALVRFGLRAADDPRITDTVKVIDHVLCVDLPYGPGWRRYNGDGYGEHEDGSPFDGTGIGRVWPLLAGERAHYELAAGHRAEAERLLAAMEAGASPGKLLPEQVWDGPTIPARELFPGRPSGSAMPLVWAHAEHIKLLRSLADGAVFDRPPQTGPPLSAREARRARAARGVRTGVRRRSRWAGCCGSTCRSRRWCIGARMAGRRGATRRRATPGWASTRADIPTDGFVPGRDIVFTWMSPATGEWIGEDHTVTIGAV